MAPAWWKWVAGVGPGLPLMAGNGHAGEDEDEQQKQGVHEVGMDGGGGREGGMEQEREGQLVDREWRGTGAGEGGEGGW